MEFLHFISSHFLIFHFIYLPTVESTTFFMFLFYRDFPFPALLLQSKCVEQDAHCKEIAKVKFSVDGK